jgi:hypothetical protein
VAYTDFDPALPDPSTDSPGECFDAALANQLAMRDAIIGGNGIFPGWGMAAYDASNNTPPASAADEPAYLVWSKGTERLKATITWGTSGATDGLVSRMVFSYSAVSGTSYDVVKGGTTNGYCDMTYDASSNLTSLAWS